MTFKCILGLCCMCSFVLWRTPSSVYSGIRCLLYEKFYSYFCWRGSGMACAVLSFLVVGEVEAEWGARRWRASRVRVSHRSPTGSDTHGLSDIACNGWLMTQSEPLCTVVLNKRCAFSVRVLDLVWVISLSSLLGSFCVCPAACATSVTLMKGTWALPGWVLLRWNSFHWSLLGKV